MLPSKDQKKKLNNSVHTTYMEDGREYKIFKNPETRLYTDTIHFVAVLKNNFLIEEASFQIDDIKKEFAKQQKTILKIGTPKIKKKIDGKVLSILTGGGGNNNYFHWLFDVLPRIEIYNKYNKKNELDFLLVPDYSKNFQIETLDLLNFKKNKILSSTSYRHISAKEIILTEHPYCIDKFNQDELNIPIWISQWLRKSFLFNNDNNMKNFPSKFYIDRGDSNYGDSRSIINEKEVKDYLKILGFEMVQLGKLSFLNQVKLFNNAEYIVGLHGAGFANIVFCKENAKVVEIRSFGAGKIIENISIQNKLNFKKIETLPSNHDISNQQGQIEVSLKQLKGIIN